MALGDTTPYWRAAMVIQLIAVFFAILSFSTPYHVINLSQEQREFVVGIWQYCQTGVWDSCRPAENYFRAAANGVDWLRAARTLMSLAWVIEVFVIALTAGALHPKLQSKLVIFTTAGVSLFAGLLGLIGVNLSLTEARNIAKHFYYRYTTSVGWAYFLFLFSQLAIIICGALHIVDGVKFSPPGDSQNGDGSRDEQGQGGSGQGQGRSGQGQGHSGQGQNWSGQGQNWSGQGQGNNSPSGQYQGQTQVQTQNEAQRPKWQQAPNELQNSIQNGQQYQSQRPPQNGPQHPAQNGPQYRAQQPTYNGPQNQAQQPTQQPAQNGPQYNGQNSNTANVGGYNISIKTV